MNICELAKALGASAEGGENIEITGLCASAAKVQRGDLFFCYKGRSFDSHEVAARAVRGGAAALVCERKLDLPVPQLIVGDGRAAMTAAAREFYGRPDRRLKMVGVTGTNGKTTVTYMLDSIFRAAGRSTGVIGTLGIAFAGRAIAPELTTPAPI